MKNVIIVAVLLLLAGGGYFLVSHLTGGSLPTFGLPIGGESAAVRARALGFVEDLHFKDLTRAANAFEPALQNIQTVQSFLMRSFGASADQLDLTEYSVSHIEMDSTGTRARVTLKIKARNLATTKVLQPEVLLFFYQSKVDQRWYLSAQ